MRSPVSMALLLLGLAAGCGAGDVGDACSRPESSDDCVDGAVCVMDEIEDIGEDPGQSHTCRALCGNTTECADGEECRGVTGSTGVRACQPVRTR